MNNYTALVLVAYQSGNLIVRAQVAAENAQMARVLLENLYGANKVIRTIQNSYFILWWKTCLARLRCAHKAGIGL